MTNRREPQNNRNYLLLLNELYEDEEIKVPEAFRARLGRMYEVPEGFDPELDGEEELVEIVPTIRAFAEEMERRGAIDYIRRTATHTILPLPMMTQPLWVAALEMQEILVAVGKLQADAHWILTPAELGAVREGLAAGEEGGGE